MALGRWSNNARVKLCALRGSMVERCASGSGGSMSTAWVKPWVDNRGWWMLRTAWVKPWVVDRGGCRGEEGRCDENGLGKTLGR
jgi:hypothetical protein